METSRRPDHQPAAAASGGPAQAPAEPVLAGRTALVTGAASGIGRVATQADRGKAFRVYVETAAALPEMSADFRELTLRIRPGIFFADDPAFKGRARELTAGDYAYTL